MKKQNACVKISGNLLESRQAEEVFCWLGKTADDYHLTIIVGGGHQINHAFRSTGLAIRFSPVGRICSSNWEKNLAREVLEENKRRLAAELGKRGIVAEIILPEVKVGGRICHINGDVMILNAYIEFDQIFILTQSKKVSAKERWREELGKIFSEPQGGEMRLEKITIVGF